MSRRYSSEELIAIAAADGFLVTRNQLKRWYRHGLLPRPEQCREAGRSGSASYFPAGTHEQLLAICHRHFTLGEKRLDHIAFWLWWEGREIEPDTVRRILEQFLSSAIGDVRGGRRQKGDYFRLAESASRQMAQNESPLHALLHPRLADSTALQELVMTLLLMAIGGSEQIGWSSVGSDFTGADQTELSTDELLSAALGPREHGSYEELAIFGDVSGVFSIADLPRLIRSATQLELDRVKRDAVTFCDLLPRFVADHEATGTLGRDKFAYGALAMLERPGLRLPLRAGVLAFFLAIRRTVPTEVLAHLDEWLTAARQHVASEGPLDTDTGEARMASS